MKTLKSLGIAAAIGCTLAGVAARAEDAPAAETPLITFSGTAAFVTDYRFRGVSLSDRDIAGQASIVATSKYGLFASIWGSTIDPIGAYVDKSGDFHNGSEQELDLTAGYTKTFGAITPTVGALYYVYPGGRGVSYIEPFATVAGAIGPVGLTLGVNYVPSQKHTGDNDNLYLWVLGTYGIGKSPFTLKASVGREKGAFDYRAGGSKIDYMVGVDAKYKFLTLGVQYIGNNLDNNDFALRHNRKNGVVASLTASF